MSSATYFVQECPTCGRTLQVRIEYLGKKVTCQHCAASFVAFDPDAGYPGKCETGISILDRAEELIESAAAKVAHGVVASDQASY